MKEGVDVFDSVVIIGTPVHVPANAWSPAGLDDHPFPPSYIDFISRFTFRCSTNPVALDWVVRHGTKG